MTKRIGITFLFLASLLCLLVTFATSTPAQQTLGGITGSVTDTSGAALPDTTVEPGERPDRVFAFADLRRQRRLSLCQSPDRHVYADVHARYL